ncbi:hypothetical protein [Polluticoccus soli]|uniref:hypothetical protein n=1 Tax=Polluticoccus soli TaxID=3034150 RepID=UPI0023E1CE67|nr:hypothetical protein [Flavipsychrobacter sp. JY13-12]
MILSKRYVIADGGRFTFDNFPEVTAEVHDIKRSLMHKPPYHKCEMVITFLRDHRLKMRWIELNPDVAAILTAGELVSGNIEALFEACRINKLFRIEYEGYIKQILQDIN